MLQANNIHRSFSKHKVLQGVSFQVQDSSINGLIGPSGGGKSVLLKILAQVWNSDAGTVNFGNTKAAEVSLMFQEGALFDSLNVFDNVAFPLVQGRVPAVALPAELREQVKDRVQYILARVGLTEAAFKMPGQLSGGMRRRVSLARALVAKPEVLLLDDPTCGLDPVASSVIMDLIVEIHKESQPTMIIVSHDLRRLLPVVDNILALFDGQIGFQGSLGELEHTKRADIFDFVSCRYDFASNGTGCVQEQVG